MFRDMRRKKQEISFAECEEILRGNTAGVMAVYGEDGYPYGVPVSYVYSDGKIIIHSATSGHKYEALKADSRVSFTVIDQDVIVPEELTSYFRSVIIFGNARFIEDHDEMRAALKTLGLGFYDNEERVMKSVNSYIKPGQAPTVAMIEIVPDHITGKQSIELVK